MKIGKQKLKSEVIKEKKKTAKPAKKEKPQKAAKANKKAKKSKLRVILPLILVLAIAGGAFAFIRHRGSKTDEAGDLQMSANVDAQKDDSENKDKKDKKDSEEDKKSKDSKENEGKSLEADGENTDGENADDAESEEEAQNPISVSDAVNFMQTLSPKMLGLSGQSMAQYRIYPGMSVVMVDGLECSELSVYSQGEKSGTNDIEGTYLLSRGELRRLFRLDRKTEEVTEIKLSSAQSATLDEIGSELSPEQSAALDEAIKKHESGEND